MSGATAADYAWLYEEWTDDMDDTHLCISFVRDLSPEEALRRINVTSDGTFGDCNVMACPARGGTVLVEDGFAASLGEMQKLLSPGTAMATVFANIKREDFIYAVDGQVITKFELGFYGSRQGSDPDRLLSDVRDLVLDRCLDDYENEDGVASALALAERATGVHLSRAHYAKSTLTGSADHLYSW